jgi:hypothetical protein
MGAPALPDRTRSFVDIVNVWAKVPLFQAGSTRMEALSPQLGNPMSRLAVPVMGDAVLRVKVTAVELPVKPEVPLSKPGSERRFWPEV